MEPATEDMQHILHISHGTCCCTCVTSSHVPLSMCCLPLAIACRCQKLSVVQVLVVQAGAVAAIVHHLNNSTRACRCNVGKSQPAACFCACSTAAAARLLGRLSSNDVAQMHIKAFNPLAALLLMMTGGCKRAVEYYDLEGNELQQPCEKSRMIVNSASEYALIKIASHCDDDLREEMLRECIALSWMGHNIAFANMLFL